MFLKAKDVLINSDAIQYVRRVQSTITIFFESDFYDMTFSTEDEAKDYLCGLSSLLDAKKVEVSR